jgi:hypothetical protein
MTKVNRPRRWSSVLSVVALVAILPAGLSPAASARGSGGPWQRLTARGVSLAIPPAWREVPPLQPRRIDREAVLTVGSGGVRPGKPSCAFGNFLIPSTGAAVIVIATPQFPAPRLSLSAAARALVLRTGKVECWYQHRGGAVFGHIAGRAYELAILVGDAATRPQVELARRVAESVATGP